MRIFNIISGACILTSMLCNIPPIQSSQKAIIQLPEQVSNVPVIQIAILLDVSGSMDGLIEQAKAQLWNMVSIMGKAKCGNKAPEIEIALYEYGRSSNPVATGYVRQISAFTKDLDKLSKSLFALQTNGGDEYCGQVIFTSLSDLRWDTNNNNYKVIFIAGNEDFLQGKLHFNKACVLAKQKGIIVNTIYCGDRQQGISEHWNLGGECGNGSYTNIDQNQKIEEIPTPYDSILFVLNDKLNSTYLYYGVEGIGRYEDQASVDKLNYTMSKSAAAKRVAVKGKSTLYNNASWDLVDAYSGDSTFISKIEVSSLPEEYQHKSREEIKKDVMAKNKSRIGIQKNIAQTNALREKFINQVKASSSNETDRSLESAIEKIIKVQAKRYNMLIN